MRNKGSKILAFGIALSMLFATMVFPASASEDKINLGDYIILGTYYGKPILWRCVSFEKISGYDESGNPIIDSTDTRTTYADGYLPLMLADRILCLKAFDAKGDNTTGSHGRGYYENGIQGYYRQLYGSNYWADSNIRDWLNSSASTGNVVWSCGNPPSVENLADGYNAYDQEAGFLSNFTAKELMLVNTVVQKSLLDGFEYSDSTNIIDNNYQVNTTITKVLQNYYTEYSEQVTDRMFLLDVMQVNNVYNNGTILGSDYYVGIPTEEAVTHSDHKPPSLNSSTGFRYWLRSPLASTFAHSHDLRIIHSDGSFNNNLNAYYDLSGVRPAFYLNSIGFDSGVGTRENPYIIFASSPIILTEPYNSNGEQLILSEGDILDIGEDLNYRNGYVNAENGFVKVGNRKITGSNIFFNNEGKIRLQDGDTAKVEKDNGDGTTDQGFIVGVFNPTGIITMILEVTGTVNEVDYTGRTRTEKFDFTNFEIGGLANFGFTVKRIPKPLNLKIKSIE